MDSTSNQKQFCLYFLYFLSHQKNKIPLLRVNPPKVLLEISK